MAQRRRGGADSDGRCDGDGNGWHDCKVVVMMVMGGTTATLIARQRCATTATESATATRWQQH